MDVERLIARHKDAVYRQMVRVCGNHEDAEDVLVEALLSAYRASEQLRDEENFRGWLATIGRRVCGKLKKRESLHPLIQLSEEYPAQQADLEDQLDRSALSVCVKQAIASLPDRYRRVYEMRDLEGMSGEEVAQNEEISLAAMKSRLHRARQMVRDALDHGVCGAESSAHAEASG